MLYKNIGQQISVVYYYYMDIFSPSIVYSEVFKTCLVYLNIVASQKFKNQKSVVKVILSMVHMDWVCFLFIN